jgi:hypothetical protein
MKIVIAIYKSYDDDEVYKSDLMESLENEIPESIYVEGLDFERTEILIAEDYATVVADGMHVLMKA